jgi:hypothetical protein
MIGTCLATSRPRRESINWKKLQAETREHFSAMVKINSSNPPGNENQSAAIGRYARDHQTALGN